MKSKVAVVKIAPNAKGKNLKIAVEQLFNMLGGINKHVKPGRSVFVKPNLGTSWPSFSVNTDLLAAVLRAYSHAGCKTFFGEDPIGAFDKHIYKKYRLKSMARRSRATLLDLRNGPHKIVKVPQPLFFKELEISIHAFEASTVVSLAKVKRIPICTVSLSLKNMKGFITPQWKRRFHCEGLEKGIVDLNKVIKPKFAIIDGTEALDMGRNKTIPMGLLIASRDLVAADTICALIMGLDPQKIDHIMWADQAGLGTADPSKIKVVGDKIDDLIGKFKFSKPADPFEIIKKYNANIAIVQKEPCCACLNELGRELKATRKQDLKKMRNVTIVVGSKGKITKKHKTLILYGNCAKKQTEKGIFVKGCPPGFTPAGTGSLRRAFRQIFKKKAK